MITILYPVIAFLVKKTALLMNKSYFARLKKQRAVENNKVLTRRGYGSYGNLYLTYCNENVIYVRLF
jgi:hypothetical protein